MPNLLLAQQVLCVRYSNRHRGEVVRYHLERSPQGYMKPYIMRWGCSYFDAVLACWRGVGASPQLRLWRFEASSGAACRRGMLCTGEHMTACCSHDNTQVRWMHLPQMEYSTSARTPVMRDAWRLYISRIIINSNTSPSSLYHCLLCCFVLPWCGFFPFQSRVDSFHSATICRQFYFRCYFALEWSLSARP